MVKTATDLTEAEVRAVREMAKRFPAMTARQIGEKFGLSRGTVSGIVRRLTRKDVR